MERVSDFVTARKERNMASTRRELDVDGGVSGINRFPSALGSRSPKDYDQYMGIRTSGMINTHRGTSTT